MPDVSHYRRPPMLLPPMIRPMDSMTPSKKSTGHPKPPKHKSPVKSAKTSSELERENFARYVLFHWHSIERNFSSRILRRSQYGSLPNIHEKFLSEEMDFNFTTVKKFKYKTTDTIRERYFIDEEKKVDHLWIIHIQLSGFINFRKERFNQRNRFPIEQIWSNWQQKWKRKKSNNRMIFHHWLKLVHTKEIPNSIMNVFFSIGFNIITWFQTTNKRMQTNSYSNC